MELDHEIQVAETLARAAGQVALSMLYQGDIDYKPANEGPVTKGDYAADRIIREGLSAHFPHDVIITEETFKTDDQVPSDGRVWFVDPIDGTSDYIRGGSEYAVMIGLAIDGMPVLGVVFQPTSGILWRARDTRQASNLTPFALAERVTPDAPPYRLNIVEKSVPFEGPVAVVSRNHPSPFVEFFLAQLPISRVLKMGSIGLKLALIADGSADFYLTAAKRIKLWDTCAPSVILTAAGGHIKSLLGQSLFFGGKIAHGIEFCATTPHCEKWLNMRLPSLLEKWRSSHYR